MKNGQQQYQFNSFLQAIHGEQLDEGVWDFAKGAATEVGRQVRDKINNYAARPSLLKDIYQAGKQASAAGDVQKVAQAEASAKQLVGQILTLAAKLGDQAPQAITQAVRSAGGAYKNKILRILAKNGQARGIPVS